MIKLEDLKEHLNIKVLEKEKPNIIIIAVKCDSCDELHPFIFSDESLYFFTHYISWHQYRTCECGNEVSVYSGCGDIVFNPHEYKEKESEK